MEINNNYLNNLDELDIWFISNNQNDLKNYKKLKECVIFNSDFDIFDKNLKTYNYLINNKINNKKLINNLIHKKYQLIIDLIGIIEDFRTIFDTHKLSKISVCFDGVEFSEFESNVISRAANCKIEDKQNAKYIKTEFEGGTVFCKVDTLADKNIKLPELHARYDIAVEELKSLTVLLSNEDYVKSASIRVQKKLKRKAALMEEIEKLKQKISLIE